LSALSMSRRELIGYAIVRALIRAAMRLLTRTQVHGRAAESARIKLTMLTVLYHI